MKRGFTLTEIVLIAVLAGFMAVGAMDFYTHMINRRQQVQQLFTRVALATELMEDLLELDYPDGNINPSTGPIPGGIFGMQANPVTLPGTNYTRNYSVSAEYYIDSAGNVTTGAAPANLRTTFKMITVTVTQNVRPLQPWGTGTITLMGFKAE